MAWRAVAADGSRERHRSASTDGVLDLEESEIESEQP